ncbi:hypothetical protein QIG37_27955, partial [Klebsiella pneumoniae]|nr:hypothetical protein [Klebsiella pneumoniae]
QSLLTDFSVFIDEISDAMFGAYIKATHTDRTDENFPFIKWLEEKDGLLFLNKSYRDDLYKYWHEKQANGEE